MNANELRLGNLVYYLIDQAMDESKSWNEVSTIDVQDLECVERGDTNYTPIPLTEEWLLKFGFVSNPYMDRYELDWLHIECNKTKGYLELWVERMPKAIESVHQLQNLYFALTNQELSYTP